MNKNNLFRILSRSAVDYLLQSGPKFREFLDRYLILDGPVRRFPNGAIEIDESRVGDEAMEAMIAYTSNAPGSFGIEGAGLFSPIGPFSSNREYAIQYPRSYQEKLKSEESFAVGIGRYRSPLPGEFELERLKVTIGFRTRPSKTVRLAFADAVASWAGSASERGAFDDGPVALISPDVSFNGIRAWFQIDVQRSGQDTLNWLSLVVLDFGEDIHTTTRVSIGQSTEIHEISFGPLRGATVAVRFTSNHREVLISGGDGEANSASHVPPTAKRAKGLRSATFPILSLPYNEWDSFTATIYFGRPFRLNEREELAKLLNGWLVLASYGGMGGRGSHGFDELEFDDAKKSVAIHADMGDVEYKISLKILIKSLEGYELHGPPIEAIVFGMNLPVE
jgi:hypothetical protein